MTTPTAKTNQNILVIIALGLIALLIICCCVILLWSFQETPKDYKTMSYIICQLYVEDNLKSPSTADFPASSLIDIRDLGNNIFEIRSYVDSQNSFGAVIRTDFFCKIQYIGTPEDDESLINNWLLLELNFPE